MQARMDNPAVSLPGALPGLIRASKAATQSGLPRTTALLVQLRVSQINGCAFCIHMHAAELQTEGATTEKLFAVSAWHDAPFFSDAERAALALAEATTRIADDPNGVPDAIWDEARAHYDDEQLAALVLEIALINTWNRLNVATRQVAGTGWSAPASEPADIAAAAAAAAVAAA